MSQDDAVPPRQGATTPQPQRSRIRDIFRVPPPIKRLFDKFPLITYAANELPARSPQRRRDADAEQLSTLYIFSTKEDARRGAPSFNPTCLKWQAYLRFHDIRSDTVASNNHASPSGALPFLLPARDAASSVAEESPPVPSSKLERWVRSHGDGHDEPSDMRYDAYISLLDHRIRNAWLYTLYLEPENASVMRGLYVDPCSSNGIVQNVVSHQLRGAAEAEIAKAKGSIDVEKLYEEAESAFEALSTLLGSNEWFFGAEKPGFFDANVFAYTHQIWSRRGQWKQHALLDIVEKRPNLQDRCRRIEKEYFENST